MSVLGPPGNEPIAERDLESLERGEVGQCVDCGAVECWDFLFSAETRAPLCATCLNIEDGVEEKEAAAGGSTAA